MFATTTGRAQLEALPNERLEADLCQRAAQSAAAMCEWLLLVGEYDRREAALTWGCASTAAWLAWQCGIDPRTAREHVRVARDLRALPAIRAAFAIGEMTYSKVRALTRVATPATEADLLDFARVATAAQLERTLRAYRRAARDDSDDEEPTSELHPHWDDDGFGRLGGAVEPEGAAVVFAALDAEAERLVDEERAAGGSAEPPVRVSPRSQRHAQALVNICGAYLGGRTDDAGDDRFLALIHVEADSMQGWVDGGPPLDESTVQRLLCDQPRALLVKDREGNPLFMGRTTRTPNRWQRRALRFRHQGCCDVPGCTTTVGLQAHHVLWWERDLGPTDIVNLVLICRRHHRLVHQGALSITGNGRGEFTYRRAGGTTLDVAPPLPRPEPTVPDAQIVDVPAGGDGERLDLSAAVDAMFSLFGRAG